MKDLWLLIQHPLIVPTRKSPAEEELLIVGRTFVLILVVVSVIWIPIINGVEGSLFDYIQARNPKRGSSISCYARHLLVACCFFVRPPPAFWPRQYAPCISSQSSGQGTFRIFGPRENNALKRLLPSFTKALSLIDTWLTVIFPIPISNRTGGKAVSQRR